jgi:O-antigen ligase
MTSLFGNSTSQDRLATFALVLVCAAPAVYGCQPPWASGFLLAAVMLLAVVFVLRQIKCGEAWLMLPAGVAAISALLLAWVIAGVLRDASLGAQSDPPQIFALSFQKLLYAAAFLGAAILGAGFGRHAARLAALCRALTVLGIVLAAFALLQFWGWDVKKLAGWAEVTSRPSGLYTNANRFAVLMTMCWMGPIALVLNGLFNDRRDSRRRMAIAALLCAACAISICIALTLSRLTIIAAAVAMLGVTIAWMVLNKKQSAAEDISYLPTAKKLERLALVALPLVVVAAWGVWCLMVGASALRNRFAELQPDLTLESRVQMVNAALPLLKEQPLWGHGLGSFETVFAAIQPPNLEGRWRELHSDWLQWAIEGGVPVLVLGVLLAGAWLLNIWRALKRDEQPLLRALPAAGVIVFLFCSLGDFPLREPASAILFFFVAGALCSTPQDGQKPASGSAALGAIAAVLFLGGAFLAGRNALAYASSPWLGSMYSPAPSAGQVDAWKRAAQIDSGDPELQFRLATAAFAASAADPADLVLARSAAQNAEKLNPRDHRFPWIEAAVAERSGELKRAAELREFAARLYPNNPVLREQNGRFYLTLYVLRSVPGELQRDEGLERCIEHFLAVLNCAPARESYLIDAMETAGCLNTEIAALWPGDGEGPRLRRARYYCAKDQWDNAERDLPKTEPAGNFERRWYHAIRGAIALRRGELKSGVQSWKSSVSNPDSALDGWLANEARELNAAVSESLAGDLMPELVKCPGLSSVLAQTLMNDRRWASADRILEKVAGTSPDLGAQWAELALQMGDKSAASRRARLAWEQGLSSPRWGDWYSQFQERIRLQKER